jgi:hypothetical protein
LAGRGDELLDGEGVGAGQLVGKPAAQGRDQQEGEWNGVPSPDHRNVPAIINYHKTS